MKIAVTGTRGIPNILGGVETHCEELYPRIVAAGHEVILYRRSCYIEPGNKISQYKGVQLRDVYAPRKKSIEAIIHTILAVIAARREGCDIIHIHAIGPSLIVPLAKLLGMKVVTTNHGPDYDRKKWGKAARLFLKAGEYMAARFSDSVIVISKVIANILKSKYNRVDTNLIYNGVNTPEKSKNTDYINSLGLIPGKYIIALGRFVEEKGFHDLISAFSKMKKTGFKLVIAGDADHESEYAMHLRSLANNTANVILPGFVKGEKLNQLLTNAALFVLPSYHEGLPISLLEAMSYNLNVAVSDIPANRLSQLSDTDFFTPGNIDELTILLDKKIYEANNNGRTYNLTDYDWDRIAEQTIEVYKKTLKQK